MVQSSAFLVCPSINQINEAPITSWSLGKLGEKRGTKNADDMRTEQKQSAIQKSDTKQPGQRKSVSKKATNESETGQTIGKMDENKSKTDHRQRRSQDGREQRGTVQQRRPTHEGSTSEHKMGAVSRTRARLLQAREESRQSFIKKPKPQRSAAKTREASSPILETEPSHQVVPSGSDLSVAGSGVSVCSQVSTGARTQPTTESEETDGLHQAMDEFKKATDNSPKSPGNIQKATDDNKKSTDDNQKATDDNGKPADDNQKDQDNSQQVEDNSPQTPEDDGPTVGLGIPGVHMNPGTIQCLVTYLCTFLLFSSLLRLLNSS